MGALCPRAERALWLEQRCVALGPERHDTRQHRADGRPVTEHVTDRLVTTPAILFVLAAVVAWGRRESITAWIPGRDR